MATQQDLEKYGINLYGYNGKYYLQDPGTTDSSGKSISGGSIRQITDLNPQGYNIQQLDDKTAQTVLNTRSGASRTSKELDRLIKAQESNQQFKQAEIAGNKLNEQNRLAELANPPKPQLTQAQMDANRNALLPQGVKPGEAYGSALTNQAQAGQAYSKNAIYDPSKLQNVNGTFQPTTQQNTQANQQQTQPGQASPEVQAKANEVKAGTPYSPNLIYDPEKWQNVNGFMQPVGGATTDTTQTGQPNTSVGVGGQTLDEIQATAIPPLPQGYGAGSGLSQVDWALQHRQNIFNAYQKYGITPTAEEVNWQLTHNPDINSIESSIAQAVSSGQDTRGKMPAGDKATTDAQNKADTTISNITTTDANGQDKTIADVVKEFSTAMGLTEISKQIQAVDDQYNTDVMAVNDNPWYSEADRSKHISLLQSKYESKKTQLVDRLKLQNDAVAKAVDYWQKDRDYKQKVTNDALTQKNKEIDQQIELMKPDTQITEAGGRIVVYDKKTNTVIQDLGPAYHAGPSVTNISMPQQTKNDTAEMADRFNQLIIANQNSGSTTSYVTPEQWNSQLRDWVSGGNTQEDFVNRFSVYTNPQYPRNSYTGVVKK